MHGFVLPIVYQVVLLSLPVLLKNYNREKLADLNAQVYNHKFWPSIIYLQ